jgi:secernin
MKSIIKRMILPALGTILVLSMPSIVYACDTWVALKDATKSGYTILAKNSDRPLFDCQPLMFYPRQKWPAGSEVNLGRITIPQVEETYATMGSGPYWCWGYEEGINEYGVAIGNEGVWTKVLAEDIKAYMKGNGPKLGPTGMDLLRLGLERGKTAREALEVITGLVEKYGQFGSGVPTQGVLGAYHNSYIIADAKEAWVLETAGTRWIAKRFSHGTTSISNKLSITTEWDLASPDIVDYAIEKGWWPEVKRDSFDFTKAYSDDSPARKEGDMRAHTRAMCSSNLLLEKEGQIDSRWMMRIARDRSTSPGIDLDQTASSCVAILPNTADELPVFWWCPAIPSMSCYVPFFIHGSKLPDTVSITGTYGKRVVPPSETEQDEFSPESYWWLFRNLCDKTNIKYEERSPIVRAAFDSLEKVFEARIPVTMEKVVKLRKVGKLDEAAKILNDYTAECLDKALKKCNELRERFTAEVTEVPKEYEPYIGKYIGNFGQFRNAEFTVLIKNDRLAVDIPGQTVVELNEPDEEGLWYFTITNTVAVSFDRDDEGNIATMKMHQTNELPRKAEQPESENVPEQYKPYVGKYTIPMANAEMTVLVQENHLALDIPGQMVVELKPPDNQGRWYFAIDNNTAVSFPRDDAGKVTAMRLHQTFELPKIAESELDKE